MIHMKVESTSWSCFFLHWENKNKTIPTFLSTQAKQLEELALNFSIELDDLTAPSCVLVTCVHLKSGER